MSQSKKKMQRKLEREAGEHGTTVKKPPITPEQKKKLVIAICAAMAVAVVVAGAIIGLVSVFGNSGNTDYLKDDLSKYVYISEQKYKNFSVDISIRKPDETDVESAVIKLLVPHRTLVGNGSPRTEGELSAADNVYIFYFGYLLGDGGEKKPFDGGSNFGDTSPDKLTLGSGDFDIPGFEYGLIGKSVKADALLLTSGTVMLGQTVYVSCERIGDGGASVYYKNLELTLGDEADAVMGEGFSAQLVGKKIGEQINNVKAVLDGKECTYYTAKVVSALSETSRPITVQAHIPHDYGVEQLRGKTVYYDVYVVEYVDYDVPEFTDTFITEVLKVSADDLAKYEGVTLKEKYEASLKAQLLAEYEQNKAAVIDEAVWDYLMASTEVKRLPRGDVDIKYRAYYSELEVLYEYAGSSYSSIGAFIRAYYGLSASADWKEYVTKQAEVAVAQKLLFYYIVRNEDGWMPSADEYERLYNAAVDERLEMKLVEQGCYRENYSSDEAYNAAVSNWRRRVIVQYGESYFSDIVYFEYGMEKLLETVAVRESNA